MKSYLIVLILLVISLEALVGRYIEGRKEKRAGGKHAHARSHRKLIQTRGIRRNEVASVVNVTQNNQNSSEEGGGGITKTTTQDDAGNGEKKSKVEDDQKDDDKDSRSKAPEEGEREKAKGMSAIVVIGNRTHRVSGPVVKQLLFELEHQNEEEKPKTVEAVPAREVDSPPAVNLRRLYAANEVAEINKLLGKPLTDAKALGLIKNLLLDKVHTHLQKTMETGNGDSTGSRVMQESSNHQVTLHPEAEQPPLAASSTSDLALYAARKHATHDSTCKDIDPKDKCQYLKELGLCSEVEKHPEVRRRCQETCGLCDLLCADCAPIKKDAYLWNDLLDNLVVTEQPRPCKEPLCVKEPPVPSLPPTLRPCKEPTCRPTKPPCKEKPTCKPHACNDGKDPSCIIVIEDGHSEKPPCKESPPCYEIHEIHEHNECKEHPCYVVHETHETHETTCKEKPCYDAHESPCKEHPCEEAKELPCKEHPCVPTKHMPTFRPTHPPAILHPSRIPHTTAIPGCESLLDAAIRPNICPPSPLTQPTPEAMLDPESTIHPLLTNLPPTPTLAMSGSTPVGTKFMVTHHGHHIHVHPTIGHPDSVDVVEPPGSTAAVIDQNGICQLPMEIGIAIDTSAAIVPHWQQMLYFVKSLVDRFQMNGVARIGIITFDTIAKIPIRLDRYKDADSVKHHLDSLFADPYGRRRTDAALSTVQNSFFEKGRPGIPKVLFIVEHGRINGGDPSINWEDLLIEPSDKLREMGVNIFAVGATPIVTPEELKVLTGDWSHVVPLQSYSQLPGIVPQLAIKACKLAGIVRRSKNPKITVH